MSTPVVVVPKEVYTWRPAFLEALAETGNVTAAAQVAGINPRTAYASYHSDAEFRKGWDIAHLAASVPLEAEARRRAVDGVLEPVFYKGEVVGSVRRYSDALLMFLLKGANPDRYMGAVTSHTIVTGADGGPVRTDFGAMLAEIRADRLSAATPPPADQGAIEGESRLVASTDDTDAPPPQPPTDDDSDAL